MRVNGLLLIEFMRSWQVKQECGLARVKSILLFLGGLEGSVSSCSIWACWKSLFVSLLADPPSPHCSAKLGKQVKPTE